MVTTPRLSKPSDSTSSSGDQHRDTTALFSLLAATRAVGHRRQHHQPSSKRGASSDSAHPDSNGALEAAARIMANPKRIASPAAMPGARAMSSASTKEQQPSRALANMPTPKLRVSRDPIQSPSPSQQAAVAAARSQRPHAGVTRERPPAVAPKPRKLSQHHSKSRIDTSDKSTDATSIPPTTSLVHLFERRANAASQESSPETLVIKSPKPVRAGITSMFQLELEGKQKKSPSWATNSQDAVAHNQDEGHSSDDSFASASEDLNAGSPPASLPRHTSASPSPGQALTTENQAKRRPPPSPSPVRQSATGTGTKPIRIRPLAPSSTALSAHSLKSIPAQFHQAYPRRMTPHMTGDELANAMVASSLASSRAPSPTKLEPPPVPTRKKKHHHHKLSFSRTPSPTKVGMLRTLRDQEDTSSDSEDERHPYGKHKKKRLVRKHPNKHHEGDRKRWRDAVTERERRRYEGVWAANKGLHYSFTPKEMHLFRRAPQHPQTVAIKASANEQVSNIVARDIWNRSRLPEVVLETVWDLVDSDSVGRLHKEEFVVGMWLIDQRLKGRKLPIKVTDTVWASVRGIQGINIRK